MIGYRDRHSLGVAYLGEKGQTVKAVVQEHSEVFQEEMGLMTDFKAKLAITHYCPPLLQTFCLT